ncbi:N-acetylmuramoyl-L-alanine amidase [Egibacter rhizosphaerae]|uniref:N-acetylmuramoyl-L-alanine amidase n=1 Tax=Egibacter rhizosphaerae TaxID=1670831 RepID=A0A411YHP1_9ACTN|nr:N-acetylmuramoyl-L-alanine amidase [Egibacter rhizosphaerae]QBI20733.1 N-acetylmuramoyl-L-alanine amidase [Egibacter rhizosphaerae]
MRVRLIVALLVGALALASCGEGEEPEATAGADGTDDATPPADEPPDAPEGSDGFDGFDGFDSDGADDPDESDEDPGEVDDDGLGGDAGHHDGGEDDPEEDDEPTDEDDGGSKEAADGPLDGAVVAIDPGHNGGNADHPEEIQQPVDAGGLTKQCNTVGAVTDDGYTEARFNWDLSRVVRDELEDEGAEVHLTREDNEGWGPCIDERGAFAGEVGADLLVSIHADGAPAQAHGFHVIHPDAVEGHTEHIVEPSAILAAHIRDAFLDAGREPATYVGEHGLVQRDDLGTLNRSDVPAVLVEVGNMGNPDDAATLASESGRAELADALVSGIEAHLDEVAADED